MSLDYVISADSHIIEPLDLWEKALGAKWGDKVPRVVDRYKGIPGKTTTSSAMTTSTSAWSSRRTRRIPPRNPRPWTPSLPTR